jgi:putative transposase
MIGLLGAVVCAVRVVFASRAEAALEILVLRQQLAALKRRRGRVRVAAWDRLFWIWLSGWWRGWRRAVMVVRPETVVRWHRAGWRALWRMRSGGGGGRPRVGQGVRDAIRRMAEENCGWGAPRIHGELARLGFRISERTVGRYLRELRTSGGSAREWRAFLENHREAIAAFDFFTVPSLGFRLLYCFFAIEHERRRVVHFEVTARPTVDWVERQLGAVFPKGGKTHRYAVFDNDIKFRPEVDAFLAARGVAAKRTGFHSPWQNGIAERWIGTCRRELTDHVIPLNESHMRRLLGEYVDYYNRDRTHISLGKDAPDRRAVQIPLGSDAVLTSERRMGGLHHRYRWKAVA